MSSSFPNHSCVHRCVGLLSALAAAGSFVVIYRKTCQGLFLHDEEAQWVTKLEPSEKWKINDYVDHFYDVVQIYHLIVFNAALFMLILGFVNIAPKNEDIRFGFHLLGIITMGSVASLSFYAAYSAFYMPCKVDPELGADKHIWTRSIKDKQPINAFAEDDYEMLLVTLIDTLIGFALFTATVIFCIDAREQAMQDEYVVRVRNEY